MIKKAAILVVFICFNAIMLYPILSYHDCRPTFCIYVADFVVVPFRLIFVPIDYVLAAANVDFSFDRYAYYSTLTLVNFILIVSAVRSFRPKSRASEEF